MYILFTFSSSSFRNSSCWQVSIIMMSSRYLLRFFFHIFDAPLCFILFYFFFSSFFEFMPVSLFCLLFLCVRKKIIIANSQWIRNFNICNKVFRQEMCVRDHFNCSFLSNNCASNCVCTSRIYNVHTQQTQIYIMWKKIVFVSGRG